MKRHTVFLALCLGLSLRVAEAQVIRSGVLLRANAAGQMLPPAPVEMNGQPLPPGVGNPAASARLQRFQQLQFDRRPSAILKAWMTPEEPDAKEEPKPSESTPASKTAPEESVKAEPGDQEKPADASPKAAKEKSNPPEADQPEDAKSPKPNETEKPSDDPKKQEAAEKAEEAKQKKIEAEKKAAEEKSNAAKFEKEIAKLQRNVTLGRWKAVKDFLATLPLEEGQALYLRILQSLSEQRQNAPQQPNMPMMQGMVPQMANFMEKPFLAADDLIALLAASPQANASTNSPTKPEGEKKPDTEPKEAADASEVSNMPIANPFQPHATAMAPGAAKQPLSFEDRKLQALGQLARIALQNGTAAERLVQRIQEEVSKPADQNPLEKIQAAKLLFNAGLTVYLAPFLPTLDKATADKDADALTLLSRYFEAMYHKEGKYDDMQRSWNALQALLETGKGTESEREQALRRALSIAPTLRDKQGNTWIQNTFRSSPDKAVEILATVGGIASRGILENPTNPASRQRMLELQKTAVEAFLAASPERAGQIKEQLSILAGNWAREADFTSKFAQSTGMGPRIQRDMYGNIFYMDEDQMMNQMRQNNQPLPISVGEILELRPSDAWLALIDGGLLPHFSNLLAVLYLKGGEEEKAFPFIESLGKSYPEKAKSLAREFLETWIKNHNPNESRRRTNPYMYFFGFEQRAESIPLTRSKQQRNLVELSGWIVRLRALPIGELDESLLARAFTTCHSSAEVYQLDMIEKVFGPIGGLKPKTLSGLANQMRANLAGLWRDPKVQQQNNTKRKPQDIQAEVLRGYQVAGKVVDDGISKFPDSWELLVVKASLAHDELNYRQQFEKNNDFVPRRSAILELFKQAADAYGKQVAGMPDSDQSTEVFDQWFYASLGACDLNNLSEEQVADPKQPPLIRERILSLPGEIADRHMTRFANALFTRMGSVNPSAKFRYLKAGFTIVGDHKSAWEAKKVFDYYQDLVTEIKFETALDGDAEVGQKPFGVFVNIRHTREIERESGGFSKYLQNQNNMYFSYNYGRPTQDYRDKFQTTVQQAFNENFEVLSVTFETDKVASKATEDYGWRVTPYAYILLKARGPEVDKIPPLRIDLDFLDTSGYVIIPIESPPLPIDGAVAKPTPRPAKKLQITQTLDERQAKDGKLVLEIKATAIGLVPDLDALLDLSPKDFATTSVDDQGVAVSRFDAEGKEAAVISERTWLVQLTAKPNLAERPKEFAFASAKKENAEMTYQRYQDADLVASEPTVTLEAQYGNPSHARYYVAAAVAAAAAIVLALVVRRLRKPKAIDEAAFSLPENITPFTVMGLLRRIEQNNGLNETQRQELLATLTQVERRYFADEEANSPDLRDLAESWLRRTR